MVFNPDSKPKGPLRLVLACFNSLKAVKWMLKNEAAFQQESILLMVSIPLAYLLADGYIEFTLLVVSVLFILLMEMVNTAIEVIVDRISLDIHPMSGLAKDLGSALVTFSIIIAFMVWGSVCL
jgi:diacylglycerol kinase (ATP)